MGSSQTMQGPEGHGKEQRLLLGVMGRSWRVLSRGVNHGLIRALKSSHAENGLKENMRILLAWVQARNDRGLNWEGGNGG